MEQFYVREAVAFMVTDSCEGDSARGDFAGHLPGVVRPMLNWKTVFDHEGIQSS
jgi:lipopolysaccharide transport system ATP-binding protein